MNKDSKPPPSDNGTMEIFARLNKHLTIERMILLADLLDEVTKKTGYGAVRIIIAEKRVVRLKDERSY